VEAFLQLGKRWSKVAQHLHSARTEHMVKNRYKTLVGQERRRHPALKDEDTLLRLFLQADTSREELTLLDSKAREDSQESKLAKEKPTEDTQREDAEAKGEKK
jgi:hypothetical protein